MPYPVFVHSPCGRLNLAFIRKIGGQTQRANPWMMTDRRFLRGAQPRKSRGLSGSRTWHRRKCLVSLRAAEPERVLKTPGTSDGRPGGKRYEDVASAGLVYDSR